MKSEYVIMQKSHELEPDASVSGKILDAVSTYYDIPIDKIKAKDRVRDHVWCRQVFCYLCLKYTKLTLAEVGGKINRTHSNAIYSRRTVEDLMSTDQKKKKEVFVIELKLI